MRIEMSSDIDRKRKRRQTERRVLMAAILIPLFLSIIIGGGFVYAKYYSQSYQNGIAIASGIYFTANYAVEDTEEVFFESVVSTIRQGDDFSFEFEVRNFENNLLFNESTVEIPYSLSFWLEKSPQGAVYSVTYGEETKILAENKPLNVTFSGHSITGGKAIANKYAISVDVEEGQKHTPIPVYVEVKTEAGAVISSVLRGRMVYSSSQHKESYIESQRFVVSDEAASDEMQFAEIQKMSGLTYEIRTVGEVSTDEMTDQIKLSWDPAILEIDLFDPSYQAWKAENGSLTTDAKGWYHITMEALPYASQTISFFKGSNFNTVDSMETLHRYIKAEKYQETVG